MIRGGDMDIWKQIVTPKSAARRVVAGEGRPEMKPTGRPTRNDIAMP